MKNALWVALCLWLIGCGGAADQRFQKQHTIETTSATGSLRGVIVNPAPGTYALDTDTRFEIYWPEGSAPPASFTVSLFRYQEGYTHSGYDSDGNSTTDKVGSEHDAQLSLLLGGESGHWQVIPKKSLTRGGLYYLELASGSDSWRMIFRVVQ